MVYKSMSKNYIHKVERRFKMEKKILFIWISFLLVGLVVAQGIQTQIQLSKGENSNQNEVQESSNLKISAGNYSFVSNKEKIEVRLNSQNKVQLRIKNISAHSELEMFTNKSINNETRLRASLSNGKYAEIKIMPDVASEVAISRLRLKSCENCSIVLREVRTKNEIHAAYEVKAEKQAKVLGLFKTKMNVQAQINAETGQVLDTKKPWWAFLASESNTSVEAE
jgi:hypothetical protein